MEQYHNRVPSRTWLAVGVLAVAFLCYGYFTLVGHAQTTQTTLTVTKAGYGMVTSIPAGISCGTICSASFAPLQFLPPASSVATVVTLTASPSAGSIFTGWSGDCSGTGACTVAMSSNHTVGATFTVQVVTPSSILPVVPLPPTTPPVTAPAHMIDFVVDSAAITNPAPGFGPLALGDAKTAVLAEAKVHNYDTKRRSFTIGIQFDNYHHFERTGYAEAGQDVKISWVLKGNTRELGGYIFTPWYNPSTVKAQWYLWAVPYHQLSDYVSNGSTTNLEVRQPDLVVSLTPPGVDNPPTLDLTNPNAVVRFNLTVKNQGTAPTAQKVKVDVEVEDPNWWQYYDFSLPSHRIVQDSVVHQTFPSLNPGQEVTMPFEVSAKALPWLKDVRVLGVVLNAIVNPSKIIPESDWFNGLSDGRVTLKHRSVRP